MPKIKQQPPILSGKVPDSVISEDEWARLVQLITDLANKHGINAGDVLTHPQCWPALREGGVAEIGIINSMMVRQAEALHRKWWSGTLDKVDGHNNRILSKEGEGRESVGGQVRAAIAKTEQQANRRQVSRGVVGGGSLSNGSSGGGASRPKVEIYGQSASAVIRWMGLAGFTFQQARAALEEIGGAGIKDTAVRSIMWQGKSGTGTYAELTEEQKQELISFRV